MTKYALNPQLRTDLVSLIFSRWSIVSAGFFCCLFFSYAANAEFAVQDVSAAEAAGLLKNNPEIKVLDVRTGFEFNRGHLKDAVNINYYSWSFEEKLAKLDKNVTWLLHCRTGVRSSKTLPLMKAAGFTSVIHLTDGIVDWLDAGFSVVK